MFGVVVVLLFVGVVVCCRLSVFVVVVWYCDCWYDGWCVVFDGC